MCGISGIIRFNPSHLAPPMTPYVAAMNDRMSHRGPDDAGIWQEKNVALGHRRLAIIDLTAAGHQPMISHDERYTIVFNGEIYNYKDIKKTLNPYPFRSNSDTEVLLAAYNQRGKNILNELNGMFAFAIWDRENEELLLARDHLGIKPIYYVLTGEHLIFASEIRALLASGLVKKQLNEDALPDYLTYQTVHTPDTLVKNVKMLPPGFSLHVKNGNVNITPFWEASKSVENTELITDRQRAVRQIREKLTQAVDYQMVCDVPFGAFLSGGIDSSILVGLMREVTTGAIDTFNISFSEGKFDESPYAREVAEKFNTRHHQINLTPQFFLDNLTNALNAMDHPSCDGVNTFMVAKATKEAGITMALSGLGGDELFAGYPIFKQSQKLQRLGFLNYVPRAVRRVVSGVVRTVTPSVSGQKMASVLSLRRIEPNAAYPLFREILTPNQISNLLTVKHLPKNAMVEQVRTLLRREDFRRLPLMSQISVNEMQSYMQNVLLRDSDQMSMAHALELRVPFLDVNLVSLALRISDDLKMGEGSKPLLVDAVRDLLPSNVYNRPKMGFVLPFEAWMKDEMRLFCAQKLKDLSEMPYFNEKMVLQLWSDFLHNKNGVKWSRVWLLVALSQWLSENEIK